MGGLVCSAGPHPPPASQPVQPKPEPVVQKCLVLGAGYSGKTTCIKHLTPLTPKDMEPYGPILEEQYKALLEHLIEFDHHKSALVEAKQDTKTEQDTKEEPAKEQTLLSRLQQLWKAYGWYWPLPSGADQTENLFSPSYQFENAKYLMDRAVARLGKPPEPVSKQDVLNARIRTTGILEKQFQMTCSDGEVLTGNVYDVGGPRNERKKWMHCFRNVTVMIFVVDLGSYCQKLWEDENTCSLIEQLELFEQICSSKWFPDTLVCLVFNHLDRFLALASIKPFNREIYPDPPVLGFGHEWEGVEYIKQLFIKKWVPRPRQATPFIVTTSLIHEHPIFFHQETKDPVTALTQTLTMMPVVLCSLMGEYATGSENLISPGLADAARALIKDLNAAVAEDSNDMGGLKCQRHTYAPQDRVR